MYTVLITIAIVMVVVLIHWSYVDFRFRYRDGIMWFWMLNPAPPIMWVARATFVAALIFSFAGHFVGLNAIFALVLSLLVILHIASLVLLEKMEPR